MELVYYCVYFGSMILMISDLYHAKDDGDALVTDLVTFDIKIGDIDAGSIDFGLFRQAAPRTVENFVKLASGDTKEGYTYTGSPIHRVIDEFMIQGGDVVHGNGSGETSIYGGRFDDEGFVLAHYGAGWLSMANAGPNTNTCQFFITAKNTWWLDEKHVVFGKVLRGMWVLKQILAVETDANDKPVRPILISKAQSANPTRRSQSPRSQLIG